ncbi:sulfoacetaldehyde dehydrogenase [Tistlia consotensis]|uniref:Sulfoacetaldehyde dehydrogenase n=1 Tax=Tistlia consotensis USBA 355 TaxID=560819 RepID=A0A1Y6CIY8_9PROT|nr:aldehyde dehydrogenase family protein [Tistlia consotensis]SMF65853.1 sulfoacetaldehyde dehydrogenase [Tistlia consotensis USBA 355]SNS03059.1 sulfoacetaldehyde dehydrogenase [Tistlia consotensis]
MTQDPVTDPRALARALSGRMLIDGALVAARSGRTFEVIDPATGEPVAEAPFGEAADVEAAVAAAVRAQKDWAGVAARQRGRLVAECARLLGEHVEELGRLLALETGKALRTESRVEASVLADVFTFFGGLGSELKGETVPFSPDMLTLTLREPIGVVGAIIPWNVPLLLMALKIAPALVAGNAVVVKAAEEAPLAVLRVAEIMNRVLPAGLFNLLTGLGPECGAPLVGHPKVGKVTFTGSVETGRTVYRAAAEKLIPVTLELGGKSPMIVMDDADLERAVAGAVVGMRFTRQGQSCTASSRIFVQDGLHDAFVERLKAKVDALVMGDPLDERTDIGAIVSPQQFERVRSYIELGRDLPGATAHLCSALPDDPALAKGLFVRPVIFTGVNNACRLAREEIFGPVCTVIRFSDYEAAIEAANDSDYGLAATIWTKDLRTALDATRRLEAGFVQVNQNLVVQPALSYGGIKQSGLGKEATLEAMLEHFTHKKTVIVNMA